MKYPDAGINPAKSGLTARAGLYFNAGLHDKGDGFNLQDLDPYLLFDAETSMLGNLENPTLDLDPATPDTLDVITATRAGIATYTAADGQIVTADENTVRVDYVQGEELTPTKYQRARFTDFSNGWLNSGVSTVTNADSFEGQVAKRFTVTGLGIYYDYTSVESGKQYTASFYARLISGNTSQLFLFNNSTDSVYTPINVTSEWQRFTTTVTSTGTSVNFGIANYSGDVVVEISKPQFEDGTTASDFVPNTTGSPKFIASATYGPRVPMLLIEPSATNLLDYSEDFSNSYWTKADTLIESNQIEAPDGTLTGSKLIEDGTDATHLLFRAGLTTLGTISIYAKKADENNRLFQIRRDGGSNSWSWFDLQAGTVEYQTNGVASIESVGNDWYRCSFTPNDSNGTVVFGLSNGGLGRGESWLGDGTSGVYVWGAQLEQGSVATSYIPTSGSAVTRNTDNLVIDGTDFSDAYNQSEGTIYTEFVPRRVDYYQHLYEFHNGGNTNRINVHFENGNARFYLASGGTTYANTVAATNVTTGELHRTGFSYKTNDASASFDGGAEITDTTVTVPSGIDRVHLGWFHSLSDTYALNGHIKRLIYWPTHSDNL